MAGAVLNPANKLIGGELVNPLEHAKVRPERIDQGVDYAGTGSLVAIARGVVTKVLGSGSGWPGNYIEYQVTDKGSPLYGQSIYYAEGVNPTVKVGQVLNAGDPVANLIPGWSTGIELGYASGVGSQSYAGAHGGYQEGHSTAAGEAFSKLVAGLGGPAGTSQGGTVLGSAPQGASKQLGQLAGTSQSTPIESGINTVTGAVDVVGAIANFVSNPVPALLTIVLVIGGALLMYEGAGRMLGFDSPVKSRAQTVGKARAVAAVAE